MVTAWLGKDDQPVPVRIIRRASYPLRFPASPGGRVLVARSHHLVLVRVRGESAPRWIDASRLSPPERMP